MTTSIMVVNFGPQPVSVETPTNKTEIIYPQQTSVRYVYDNQSVTVRESPVVPIDGAKK